MSGKKKFEKCLIQLKDVNILGVSTLHSVFFFCLMIILIKGMVV